MTSKQCT